MSEENIQTSISMAEAVANARGKETPGEQEVKNSKSDVSYITCPCCGKLTLVQPVEVKGEVLDHYMACIMSGTPFWHTYKIYGDKIEATATQLDRDTAKKLQMLNSDLGVLAGYLTDEVTEKSRHIWNMCGMYIHIQNIKIHAKGDTREFLPQETAVAVCDMIRPLKMQRLKSEITDADVCDKVDAAYKILTDPAVVSAVPNRTIMALIEAHNALYDLLLASGFDANFWDGIELA